jgi:hypothetical protein
VSGVRMTFDVGDTERHQVVFSFNKFWGNLSIAVDNTNIVRAIRLASLDLVKRYEFVVGTNEQHQVRIENIASGTSPDSGHNPSTPTSTTNWSRKTSPNQPPDQGPRGTRLCHGLPARASR